jgi:hypothetical protein
LNAEREVRELSEAVDEAAAVAVGGWKPKVDDASPHRSHDHLAHSKQVGVLRHYLALPIASMTNWF